MPIAYLSRLDFHFRWAIPLPNPVDYSKALNAGGREVGWTKESQDADKNGEYLVNDDDDNLLEEDDESLTVVDDDEEDMLEDDVQREEGAGSQGLHDAEIQGRC